MKNLIKKVKEFVGSHKFYNGVIIFAMAMFLLNVVIGILLGNISKVFDNLTSFIWCGTSYLWYNMYYDLKNKQDTLPSDDSDKKISPDNPF